METMRKALKKVRTNLVAGFLGVLALLFTMNADASTILGDFLKDKGVEIEASATMDVYNKYVWRGMLLDDDVVIQPGFALSAYGFEAGFWGSWDVDANDSLNSDEADGYIGYSFDLGFIDESLEIVSLSAGHTWYGFPQADLYAKEYYIGIALDTFLSPSFTYYNDYSKEDSGGADGQYYILGIGHSLTLNEDYGISLDLGYEVGFNSDYFMDGKGGYHLLTTGVTLPLTENLTMSPSVGYSVPFGDLGDADAGNQKEQVYAGVSLAFSF